MEALYHKSKGNRLASVSLFLFFTIILHKLHRFTVLYHNCIAVRRVSAHNSLPQCPARTNKRISMACFVPKIFARPCIAGKVKVLAFIHSTYEILFCIPAVAEDDNISRSLAGTQCMADGTKGVGTRFS